MQRCGPQPSQAQPWRCGRRLCLVLQPLLQPLLIHGLAAGAFAQPASQPSDCAEAMAAAQRQPLELQRQAPDLTVLLLGEIHTSAEDHDWQLQTLETLWRQGQRPLSLGLEMVPAARQPVLDRFNAGRLPLEALLLEVDWATVWGHDPELYAPLLQWARLRGVPLLALNAEPALVRRVRRQGWAAIPVGEREGIGRPAPATAAQRRRLEASWRAHQAMVPPSAQVLSGSDRDPGPADDLERFIDSQLLRDRAMAERVAAAQRRDPARLPVVLVGVGHLEGNDGLPHQLRDLGLTRQLSLQRPELPQGCSLPPRGARLGAYLESDEQGVWVRQVAPESAAAAAGLRPGDRILELNGRAVQRAGQVIRGVRLQPDDLPLQLTIDRAGKRLQLQLRLPPASEPRLADRDNGGRTGDPLPLARRPVPSSPTRRLAQSPP